MLTAGERSHHTHRRARRARQRALRADINKVIARLVKCQPEPAVGGPYLVIVNLTAADADARKSAFPVKAVVIV
jgi:hypothetical protein